MTDVAYTTWPGLGRNPFDRSEWLRIDECGTTISHCEPSCVRALLVVPSARGERNPGAIERRLTELATQGVSARLVAFHEEVGLKVVPNLQMFEELTTLQSAARTMVDWTRNHRFANLRDVWIDGYPDDSLQRFDSGALKVVELFHGRLSNVDLSCIQLRLRCQPCDEFGVFAQSTGA